MITLKIISWILSIPIFKTFSISDSALDSVKSIAGYLYQINSFVNLDLLLDTVVLSLTLLLGCCIANFFQRVL